MGNVFQQDMVRMKFAPDMGGMLSVAGFSLTADKDGCVEVPRGMVEGLKSHGLTEYTGTLSVSKKQ